MKAFVLTEDGPRLADVEAPKPRPFEVLVRVRAAALNRVDLAMTRGHVHGGAGGLGAVLGLEWAGEIVETGPDVQGLSVGQRVMGSGAGAFAEYTTADGGAVWPIPDADMSFETAATLPVALRTMHDAVVTNGAMQPGQAVMINGASSGVGLMGLQIAKALGARLVVGSSTSPERRARLADFGADLAIDPNDAGWVDEVLAATDGKGVDLVVDQVSGPGLRRVMQATRVAGRIVNVGRLGGEKAEFDFDLHALRRIAYVGVTFRTRSRAEVREVVRRAREDLWTHLVAGRLTLPVDRVYPLEEIEAALARMKANAHFGKVVVGVP